MKQGTQTIFPDYLVQRFIDECQVFIWLGFG